MPRHPLEDAFDLPSSNDPFNTPDYTVGENPDFETIINLSLQMYEQQMAILEFVEPKNRLKYIEVANSLLNTAKDAMAKKKAHELALKRVEQAKKPKMLLEVPTEGGESQALISRDSLFN